MRILSTITLFALLVPGYARPACLDADYSLATEFSRASAVVIAEAQAERIVPDDPDDSPGFAATIYSVEIDESFRGPLRGNVELYSENSSGRFPMDVGKKYILFMYNNGGTWSADDCGNSGLVVDSQEVIQAVRKMSSSKAQKPN